MKKNIKIILLLFLFLAIPKNTKALEENEYKAFNEFKYNDITIPEFIVSTNSCYLETKINDIYSSWWEPKEENKEKYIIFKDQNNNIYLAFIMRNYKYYRYGYTKIENGPNFSLKIFKEKKETDTYYYGGLVIDGQHEDKTTYVSNEMENTIIVFKLIENEWIQLTDLYNQNKDIKYMLQSYGHSTINMLLGLNYANKNYEAIKSNIIIYNYDNSIYEYNKYSNEEITNDYTIEDSTEEKETINENEIIINENITNLIKTNFLQISKNENLYKIIITIFITSLIIIIKNKI